MSSSSTTPPVANGRSASSASTSPIGSSPATSRSSEVTGQEGETAMGAMQKTITPIDGSLYIERPYNATAEIAAALASAIAAAKTWRNVPVAERARLLAKAVDAFVSHKADIAEEITRQIGRPLGQSPGEVRGFEERARYMIEIRSEESRG